MSEADITRTNKTGAPGAREADTTTRTPPSGPGASSSAQSPGGTQQGGSSTSGAAAAGGVGAQGASFGARERKPKRAQKYFVDGVEVGREDYFMAAEKAGMNTALLAERNYYPDISTK